MMKTVGIIGYGNMGSVIAESIKAKYKVFVFDKDKEKTKNLSNIVVVNNILDLVKSVDVVILAVKPQDFEILLDEIQGILISKVIISIAAGISTDYLLRRIPYSRVIRAMPNLLAKIGQGTTFLYKTRYAKPEDIGIAKELFSQLGKIWLIEEKMMNAGTVASGTGPAICCYKIELGNIDYHSMKEGQKLELIKDLRRIAQTVGFNSQDANILAKDVVEGVVNLLNEKGISPSELRKQITSQGGTTQAALEVLNNNGSLEEAANAALKRAKELSKT